MIMICGSWRGRGSGKYWGGSVCARAFNLVVIDRGVGVSFFFFLSFSLDGGVCGFVGYVWKLLPVFFIFLVCLYGLIPAETPPPLGG